MTPTGGGGEDFDVDGEMFQRGAVQVGANVSVGLLGGLGLLAYGAVEVRVKVTSCHTVEHWEFPSLDQGEKAAVVRMPQSPMPNVEEATQLVYRSWMAHGRNLFGLGVGQCSPGFEMPLHDRHDSHLEWGRPIGGQGNVDREAVAGALAGADYRR